MAKKREVPRSIKVLLGYDPDDDDGAILDEWKGRLGRLCKPCWELKYCPYGPLVEDYPLIPPTRESVIEHNAYLQACLDSNTYGLGDDKKPLEDERRELFEEMIAGFDPDEYPEEIPTVFEEAQCSVYGHICPVVYTAEPFSETSKVRDIGRRTIPFKTKARVARRDNYTCQKCGKHLRDDDMEFDHLIPVSKGGSNEEHNVRLTCFDCNRKKSNRVDEILGRLDPDDS